jgi:hypothetical protein
MSARIESLFAQLQNIKQSIAERAAVGQPVEDLILAERNITAQLTKARELLTEGSAKVVLRG